MTSTLKPLTAPSLPKIPPRTLSRWLPLIVLTIFMLAAMASAQTGFATTEITTPIKNLVKILNATIAGLSVLSVIYLAIKWIGGDENAAKRIIMVILAAVIALGAANFLGFITGKADFDSVTVIRYIKEVSPV